MFPLKLPFQAGCAASGSNGVSAFPLPEWDGCAARSLKYVNRAVPEREAVCPSHSQSSDPIRRSLHRGTYSSSRCCCNRCLLSCSVVSMCSDSTDSVGLFLFSSSLGLIWLGEKVVFLMLLSVCENKSLLDVLMSSFT